MRGLRRHATPRWRRLAISAEKVQEFCVWCNAPMRVLSLQGDLVDSYDPALKERRTVLLGLRALLHVQGREAGWSAGGARAPPGQGKAIPAAHLRVRRFDAADVQPGLSGRARRSTAG